MFGFICRHPRSAVRTSLILELHVRQNPSTFSFVRCISSNETTNSHSFTVSYLVSSCGLSPESALSASKRVHFESSDKSDSILSLFKAHGFSQTQISNIVQKCPRLLLSNPEKTVLPKLEFFYSKGFSSSEASNILSCYPLFLHRSLKNHIVPSFDILKKLLQSEERTVRLIKNYCFILGTKVAPKINFLRDNGVQQGHIVKLIYRHPDAFILNLEQFKKTVNEVREMGFEPSKSHFLKAAAILSSTSRSVLERKIDVYKRWDWSEEEILAAFRKQPMCMATSENKIMAVMDLLVNKLGWESSFIAKHPTLTTFSLEKRLIPRVSVLRCLLSKGLVKKDFRNIAYFYCSETLFLQKFVYRHAEAPELLKTYGYKLNLVR